MIGFKMIFLASTLDGLRKAVRLKIESGGEHRVWCGSDLMSEDDDLYKYVSRFDYPLTGVEVNVLEEALDTIREHHPDDVIWIEAG